jgi:hypothetical protein
LAVVAFLLIATAATVSLGSRLASTAFDDVTGAAQAVPIVAVALSLLAFTLAWAFLLAGTAGSPGGAWIIVAMLFVYGTIVIGLAIGRSWLHLLPLCLPIALGALTPGNRPWATAVLALAVISIAIRLSPLPPAIRAVWYVPWLPAAALVIGAQHAIARRPWPSAARRVALAAGVVGLYLALISAASPIRAVTEAFHVALNNGIGVLEVLWFLLGASFIGGGIAFGQFAQRIVDVAVPRPTALWLLPAAWAGVAIWLVGVPADPAWARTLGVAILVAASVALPVRWWRRGMTRAWMVGWFVASIAALGVLKAYVTLDLGDVITREAGLISLVAFIYAVVWEVVSRIPDMPLETPRFARLSPLLILLGVVLLMVASALFGFAANLKYFQQVVVFAQYRGALALWLPLLLLVIVDASGILPERARRRLAEAFAWGIVVGIPVFLTRAIAGPDVGNWSALISSMVLAGWLIRRWPEAATPLAAAAVAGAAAFGSAVSVSSQAFVSLVPPLLTMVAALGGPVVLRQAAGAVTGWAASTGWGPRDQVINFAVTPLVVVALAAGSMLWRDRGAAAR